MSGVPLLKKSFKEIWLDYVKSVKDDLDEAECPEHRITFAILHDFLTGQEGTNVEILEDFYNFNKKNFVGAIKKYTEWLENEELCCSPLVKEGACKYANKKVKEKFAELFGEVKQKVKN